MQRACVIIPTYNNASTICDVVRRAYAQLQPVIVVNDGSTDDTLAQLDTLQLPITLVTYSRNRGKGHALKAGFKKALELGCDYAVTIDADGQHYPEDIPALLRASHDNPGAIIVGGRNLQGMEMSGGSRFANSFSNFWFAVQTARYLPDTQTGFRVYPLRCLHWLGLITSRYEAELELMVYASWHDVPIVTVPINVYYPPRDERVSHFRPARDFMRITMLNTVLCFVAGFYAYPRKLLKGLRATFCSLFMIALFLLGFAVMTSSSVFYMLFASRSHKARLSFHRLLCALSRFAVKAMPCVRSHVSNPHGETFSRPAVIISNHQSILDLLYAMALTPRLVILTKQWVWNNPLFAFVIRYAQFLPVTRGYDQIATHCRELADRGYSILIYPEGTRSPDCRVQRFHSGAFLLAQQLQLDILPIVMHGPGHILPKKGFPYLRAGQVHIEIMQRISPDDTQYGDTIRTRARNIEAFFREHTAHCPPKKR